MQPGNYKSYVRGNKRKPRKNYNSRKGMYTYKIAQKAARSEIAKNEKANVEMKSYDTTYLSQVVPWVGYVHPITPPIVKGVEAFNRIGSEVKVKGILARLTFRSAFTYNHCRMLIIRWNCSGTPALNNILQFTGAVGSPFSPLIRDASHKFQVLYDTLLVIGTQADTQHTVEKVYIKNPGTAVWDDNNGGQKGQIFACFISGALAEGFDVEGQFRVRFTDQ